MDPDVGVTESQLPVLVTLAWKLAVPPDELTFNCPGVTVPPLPAWKAKLSDAGLTVTAGWLTTLRLTCTTTALPPVGEIVIVPLWFPLLRLAWFTETVRMVCVVPESGLTESQLPVLEAAAVNGTPADPAALDTVSVCVAGAEPPDTAEKPSAEALTVMLPPEVPVVLTTRFTSTVTVAPLALRTMLPA